MRLVNLATGDVRPVPCRRLACEVCIRSAAWRRSHAIRAARPQRLVTLTDVGDHWQQVRGRMKRLRYDVAEELGAVELVWTVEQNPKGTGYHVHAWQRGDFLPQARLSEMAVRRGFGPVLDIRRWRGGGESYALKEAYAVKDAEAASSFLEMNGGRLTHQTRGFFGMPVREAERLAVAEVQGETDPWAVVSVAELDRMMPRPRS